MSAVSIITSDHRSVEKEYERFTQAQEEAREPIARKIISELAVHSAMEEMRLYPAVRKHLGSDGEKLADRSYKEHRQVAEKLAALEEQIDKAHTKAFAERMESLMKAVMKHVEEEEQEILPRLQEAMDRGELAELGRQLEDARKVAPTHPHPETPKEGVPGMAANVMGKAVDVVRDRAAGR